MRPPSLPTIITIAALFFKAACGQSCSISSGTPLPLTILDSAPVGEPITIASKPATNVVSVIVHDRTNIIPYFVADLNDAGTEVELKPTDQLGSYLNRLCTEACYESDRTIRIFYNLTCGGGGELVQTGLLFSIEVTDGNNHVPEFDRTGPYELPFPVKGAPFNLKEPLKVIDRDCMLNSNNVNFATNMSEIIVTYEAVNIDDSRLDHYAVYFQLTDDYDVPRKLSFEFTASVDNNPVTKLLELEIDELRPNIITEGYDPILKNIISSQSSIIAKISGIGNEPINKLDLKIEPSNMNNYFELDVAPSGNEVTITLIQAIPEAELGDNYLQTINLGLDPYPLSSQIKILFEKPKAIVRELHYIEEVTGEEEKDFELFEDLLLVDPSDPDISFQPIDLPDYLSFNNGKITLRDPDLIGDTSDVDIFYVTASRSESSGGGSKTIVCIIHKNPAIPTPTTVTPVDCSTIPPTEPTNCPTSTSCDCPTTEQIPECLTTVTVTQCPTTETTTAAECTCPTDTPMDCPTTVTPPEIPTSPTTDCPVVTCPDITTPEQCSCPTDPPVTCPTTIEPCVSTSPTTTPEQCSCPTDPPVTCPTTIEPRDSTSPTTTPEQCSCPTDPPITCPTTIEPCDCTSPPTSEPPPCVTTTEPCKCPSTPPECPHTSEPPLSTSTPESCDCAGSTGPPCDCSSCSTGSPGVTECPTTTPEPCNCPTTPVDCPIICTERPTIPPGDDDDCSNGGLIAAVAVLATLSVLSGAAAAYLAYTYLYKAKSAFMPSGTEFVTKTGDPEMGVNTNTALKNSVGGNGTLNSATFGNGNLLTNGSLRASSAPTFPQGSVPNSGFDSFGTIRPSEVVSPMITTSVLAASPAKAVDSTPEYSYTRSIPDFTTGKNPETASEIDSLYAQPNSEAGRKSSLAKNLTEPKMVPAEVPVAEPKVDYNRVMWADKDDVKILEIDADVEGSDDGEVGRSDNEEVEGSDDADDNNNEENTEDK